MKSAVKNKPTKLVPSDFEEKYRQIWLKHRIYQPEIKSAKKPFYNLMMFPYPSAEGLHVGNVYAFSGADIYGRFKRMQGYDVFEPIGLDGFGIHSENYAIKIGKNPKVQAKISEKNFYRQLQSIGNGFAWENRLQTYDPDYYRWTQWIFVAMFKKGLAYRKKSAVNFCPKDKTVLSDEQVVDGLCERCGSAVEKRDMEQWFFRITKYAQRLLDNTYKESFKWTKKVIVGQRNWIGKKVGINITYLVVIDSGVSAEVAKPFSAPPKDMPGGSAQKSSLPADTSSQDVDISAPQKAQPSPEKTSYTITCFTTRPDTNFGATFVVIAPEHPFVSKLQNSKFQIPNSKLNEIKEYLEKAKNKSERERIAEGKKKTGVFTGFYALNQLNNYKMPIWISDFALGHVGTGAVVGVPGHDVRDFEFAKEFNIPIIRVVAGKDGDRSDIKIVSQVQEEEGVMINSGFLDGRDIHTATKLMMDYIEKKGWGKRVTTYKLRDWCISRQRYWGAPIPMIKCPKCGWVAVPEKDLPVLLPDLDDWKPEGTGKGPLAKLKDWVNVTCPECGGPARRETDVCDTFLDSAWYFLRYPSVNNVDKVDKVEKSRFNLSASTTSSTYTTSQLPWDPQITRRWLPVNQYIGGAEHTVLHLLYARFIWMCFYDWGMFNFSAKGGPASGWEEPFSAFFAHGLIIKNGAKMSKSRGNVVVPDEYIKAYGVDTLRMYLMFLGPFDAGGDFSDTGIAGMYRFLSRVWRLVNDYIENGAKQSDKVSARNEKGRPDNVMHKTIKGVGDDLEHFRYNTAIAKLMEYVNEISNLKSQISNQQIKTLILLLAPFAPYMSEELFQKMNKNQTDSFVSVHVQSWPKYDENLTVQDLISFVIQVNGKVREVIKIQNPKSKIQKEMEELAMSSEKVRKYLGGKKIRKVVFVPGKIINFVS